MAGHKAVDFCLQLGLFRQPFSCYVDVTGAYQAADVLARRGFSVCNRIRRAETCAPSPKRHISRIIFFGSWCPDSGWPLSVWRVDARTVALAGRSGLGWEPEWDFGVGVGEWFGSRIVGSIPSSIPHSSL